MLGLVCHAFGNLPGLMRLTADKTGFQMRYPIHSLSNIPTFPSCRKARSEAVETRRMPLTRIRPASRLKSPVKTWRQSGGSFFRTSIRRIGGADRDRTGDPLLAKQVLSQLSYSPTWATAAEMVGLGRVELPTSPLSGVRSNQLSYRPKTLAGFPAEKEPGDSHNSSLVLKSFEDQVEHAGRLRHP
jgi:hypothetical protein